MAVQGLDIECQRSAFAPRGDSGLFSPLVGAGWDRLPSPVRRMHGGEPMDARGTARVDGETHWAARLVRAIARLPPPADLVELALEIRVHDVRESWLRRFGQQRMRTELTRSTRHPAALEERLGPARLTFAFEVVDARLHWIVREVRVFGIVLPLRWFRGMHASCGEERGRYAFDIDVRLPLVGRLVAYSGWLEPLDAAA